MVALFGRKCQSPGPPPASPEGRERASEEELACTQAIFCRHVSLSASSCSCSGHLHGHREVQQPPAQGRGRPCPAQREAGGEHVSSLDMSGTAGQGPGRKRPGKRALEERLLALQAAHEGFVTRSTISRTRTQTFQPTTKETQLRIREPNPWHFPGRARGKKAEVEALEARSHAGAAGPRAESARGQEQAGSRRCQAEPRAAAERASALQGAERLRFARRGRVQAALRPRPECPRSPPCALRPVLSGAELTELTSSVRRRSSKRRRRHRDCARLRPPARGEELWAAVAAVAAGCFDAERAAVQREKRKWRPRAPSSRRAERLSSSAPSHPRAWA